jgi:hypothetical protein
LIGRMLQCLDESQDPFHLHWFERSMTGWLEFNALRHCGYVDQIINPPTRENAARKCLGFSS